LGRDKSVHFIDFLFSKPQPEILFYLCALCFLVAAAVVAKKKRESQHADARGSQMQKAQIWWAQKEPRPPPYEGVHKEIQSVFF
jgi:hypothetical protein